MRKIFFFPNKPPAKPEELALSIGNFDGLHLGHLKLLLLLKREATLKGLTPSALTFEPHPKQFFNPQKPHTIIHTNQTKLYALSALGIRAYLLRFRKEIQTLKPSEFLDFCQKMGVKLLVLGEGSMLGRRVETEPPSLLSSLCKERGMKLLTLKHQTENQTKISSSSIREFLKQDNLEGARLLLGRRYGLVSRVVHGKKLGRTLGFPTLNLHLNPKIILNGVYSAILWRGKKSYIAAAHVSFDSKYQLVKLEVHVPNLDLGWIYGERVGVSFHEKIRQASPINNLEHLKKTIQTDIQTILLSNPRALPEDNPLDFSWLLD